MLSNDPQGLICNNGKAQIKVLFFIPLFDYVSIHICVTLQHVTMVEAFLKDLSNAVWQVSWLNPMAFSQNIMNTFILFPFSFTGEETSKQQDKWNGPNLWTSIQDH